MSLKDKRVLITGASGNIGSLLVQSLKGWGKSIMSTDLRNADIIKDMTQEDAWHSFEGKIDTIFHLAAQTSAYRANASITDDWKINVKPVIGLLDFLKDKTWRPEIIFSSTATVVGLVDTWPVPSTTREVPLTVYDIHKLTVEKYLKYYRNQLGGQSAVLRLANVYGPGGGDTQVKDRGIVNQMVRKAIEGEALTLYGRGDYVRDYIYIQDIVDAFIAAGEHVSALNGESYFIGTGIGHTIRQLAEKISEEAFQRTGHRVAIKQEPFPGGALTIEERSFVADSEDFKELTGWTPAIGLDQGVTLTTDHFTRLRKSNASIGK